MFCFQVVSFDKRVFIGFGILNSFYKSFKKLLFKKVLSHLIMLIPLALYKIYLDIILISSKFCLCFFVVFVNISILEHDGVAVKRMLTSVENTPSNTKRLPTHLN